MIRRTRALLTILIAVSIVAAFAAAVHAAGTIELDKTTYNVGDTITVTFAGSETTADWVGICAESAPEYKNNALPQSAWKYVSSNTQSYGTAVLASGTVTFPYADFPIPVGAYKIYFFTNDSYDSTDVVHFTIQESPQTGDRGGSAWLFAGIAAMAAFVLAMTGRRAFRSR